MCQEGGYEIAIDGVKEAVKRGFRVTTNTTLFDGADPKSVREFFDEMMELGVEGMMLRRATRMTRRRTSSTSWDARAHGGCSATMLSNRNPEWKFNQSPLFLEFLMGKRDYGVRRGACRRYNLFGWQKPCYLLQDGYAETFAELMESTEWASTGRVRQSEVRKLHGAQRL